jgi:hypothetical protein
MKRITTLALACLLSGCMSPNLCGLKGIPLKTEKSSIADEPCAITPQKAIQLKQEYIKYFVDNPTRNFEESDLTVFPLGHKHDFLQKNDTGYIYYLNVSLIGGLLIDGRGVLEFNKNGDATSGDLSLNSFSSLLVHRHVQFYLHEADSVVHGNFSIQYSALSGLLYSQSKYCDLGQNIEVQDRSFLCKAFGCSKSKNGSRFLTLLWMPIKISEPVK